MIFQQLFDKNPQPTHTLFLVEGREALIIDPVIEHTENTLKF